MSQRRRISQWDLDMLQQQREELERLIEDMRWARAKRQEEERERLWQRLTSGRPLPPRRARKRSSSPTRSEQASGSSRTIVRASATSSRDRTRRWDAESNTSARRPARPERFARADRRKASVPEAGTARDAAAALTETRRLGRPANATGAVAFYARTTSVSRANGASDGGGAASADRLAAKVDYYTRHGGDEAAGHAGPKPLPEMAGAVDAKLDYFERAGAPVEAVEDGDVLAIVSNMGSNRAVRRGVARAVEKAERSWKEGGLNRTRAASAELATTQVYELPHELTLPQLTRLIEKLVEPIAAEGVFYLAVIHRPPAEGDRRNVHLHLLWTHRPGHLLEDGEAVFQPKKTRALRGPAFLKEMRRRFAELANATLAEVGAEKRHFAGSYAAEGLGHLKGGRHWGPAATALNRAHLAAGRPPRDQQCEAGEEKTGHAVLSERTVVLATVTRLAAASLDAEAQELAAEAAELDRRIAIARSLQRARRAVGHGIAFIPDEGGIEAIALSSDAADEARDITGELRLVREIAPSALAAWTGTHQGQLRRSWDGHTTALLCLFDSRYGGEVSLDSEGRLRVGLAEGRHWSKPASWVADVLRKRHGAALHQRLSQPREGSGPPLVPIRPAAATRHRPLPPSRPDPNLGPELAALHAMLGGRRAVTRRDRQSFPGALRIDDPLTSEMEDAIRKALASAPNMTLRQLAIDTEDAYSFSTVPRERTGYESALSVIRRLAKDRGVDLATGIHDPRRAADPALAFAHADGPPRPRGRPPVR
jgi:hypothetical protein